MTLIEILARLRQYTVEDGDCQRWTGACCNGHPAISVHSKTVLTRRALWEAEHGPIPAGKIIKCACGTPKCVSLEHLSLTTRKALAQADGVLGKMSGTVRSAKIAATKRAGRQAKITQEIACEIRVSDAVGSHLARQFNLSESTVSRIRRNQTWRDYGTPWQGLGA